MAGSRVRRSFMCLAGALAAVGLLPVAASATPGQVDATFGHLGDGTVVADIAQGDYDHKVLTQPDGKVVTIAGTSDVNGNTHVIVSRYRTNGSLDPTFGAGGIFSSSLLGTGAITDGVLQSDGKIVIVGFTSDPADFFVTRLRANGTLDPAFALRTTNFGSAPLTADSAFAVALAPGGKIVVAGESGVNLALARYTSTGNLDTTFSGDGRVTHNFGGGGFAQARDVAVQADGRIVVGGFDTFGGGLGRNLVARFNTNGSLDTTFGTGGRVASTSTPILETDALVLQGTKVVIGGGIDLLSSALARYNANGTIDATFGSGGTTRADVGAGNQIRALATDASGRLVAAGYGGYSERLPEIHAAASVFRFSANGVRDQSFGCGGFVLSDVLGNGRSLYVQSPAWSVATAGDDIVIAGNALLPTGSSDVFVTRLHGGGPHTAGYALLRGDGGTSAFGGAPACGSMTGLQLNAPIVGTAFDPVAPGNWAVASDGGIFSFGAARFHGSTGGIRLTQPIVGMAAAPDGRGYWLVARDGGVFAFGSAHFYGSTGAIHLNQPIVGMAAARDGRGYWLVASDGGVFAFGSAKFYGSAGAIHLNKPIVGMAAAHDGHGYWFVASDGGVFSYGSAHFSGSTGAIHLAQPIVGMAADPDGRGYWLAARDGGVFAFDAKYAGSTGATPFPLGDPRSTIGIAATP